jgi:hypothetical protein
MTSTQPTSWWRGYVNQMTYGLDPRHRVENADVAWIADDMIAQRTFTDPVTRYYEAATAALESGGQIANQGEDEAEEEGVRDFLVRLVQALDERRPWPEPPFYTGDQNDWSDLRDAPAIARIPHSQLDVEGRLNRTFFRVGPGDDDQTRVLILRLLTGQVVALLAPYSFSEPGVELLANTDKESTITAFRELTGLDVESH